MLRNGNSCSLSSMKTCIGSSDITSDPFALPNLLPIGTVTFTILDKAIHSESIDELTKSWNDLLPFEILQNLIQKADDDIQLLKDISYLQQHSFLVAKCRVFTLYHSIVVRIYIIPYDLPNVKGRLHNRPEVVLGPARKCKRRIFSRICTRRTSWDAECSEVNIEIQPFLPVEEDDRTLSEIFADLPSPEKNIYYKHANGSLMFEQLMNDGIVPGMRSILYSYQRESVAAMLSREETLASIPNPLYVKLDSIDGQHFYFQPGTMEIRRECPMAHQERSGILCEELGTGKTVMILALILCTMDVLPAPEESHTEVREVLTPLAYRHFPFQKYKSTRKLLNKNSDKTKDVTDRIPSLVELLLDLIRLSDTSQEQVWFYEDRLKSANLWEPLMYNTPFYFQRDEGIYDAELSPRKRRIVLPRITYLTTATLIIVPTNLLLQWNNEILKHCEISLRVLVVESSTKLPDAVVLASAYDIVLMTYQRFSNEAALSDVAKLRRGYTCHCPPVVQTRVPECHCSKVDGVSPLTQIRWKRLVVDEGHTSATITNNLTYFSKILSVERRWIVTGTPTTNLLGLGFGGSINNDSADDVIDEADMHISEIDTDLLVSNANRPWTKYDREDLRKLGNMMAHFLNVPLFSTEQKSFDTHVIDPLMQVNGPYNCSIQVFTQVMTSIMIRHRVEDIEKDIVLPPIKHEYVLLDLGTYALRTYNVLLSSIVVNAIDSERTDIDYLFHSRNAAALMQVIENISQTLFWHVDSHSFDWDLEALKIRTEDALRNVLKRNQSDADIQLARTALRHLEIAIADKLWRNLHSADEAPYQINNLPKEIEDAWKLFPQYLERPYFLTPARILNLRQIVVNKPLISIQRLIDHIDIVREEEAARRAWYEARQMSRKSKSRREDEKGEEKARSLEFRKIIDSPEKLEELRQAFVAADRRLQSLFRDEESITLNTKDTHTHIQKQQPSLLLRHSTVAGVKIGNSVSSKLNYILNEVIKHSPKEKFLIFSRLPLTLAHLAEGLALANIKFVEFRSGVEKKKQNLLVSVFETLDSWRVCLMELKYGARGLNIVSASRVIFCEPVWHADVESQAIKRAHRIGQTKRIIVKTLAIRSTFEEEMLNRRRALKNGKGKSSGLTDDRGIRIFLQNPQFLEELDRSTEPALDIPLLPVSTESIDYEANVNTSGNEGIVWTNHSDHPVAANSLEGSDQTTKKHKRIRFV